MQDEDVLKVNDFHRVGQGPQTLARLVEGKKKSVITMNKLLTVDHFDLIVECVKNFLVTADFLTARPPDRPPPNRLW